MEKDIKMLKSVVCTCRYCGGQFAADSRHPHAGCCGKTECRRKACALHSRNYYRHLKFFNPKAYSRMLARKKCERELRCPRRAAMSAAPGNDPALPKTKLHEFSPRMLAVLLNLILERLFTGMSAPSAMQQVRDRLLSVSAACPSLRTEIYVFLSSFPYLNS